MPKGGLGEYRSPVFADALRRRFIRFVVHRDSLIFAKIRRRCCQNCCQDEPAFYQIFMDKSYNMKQIRCATACLEGRNSQKSRKKLINRPYRPTNSLLKMS